MLSTADSQGETEDEKEAKEKEKWQQKKGSDKDECVNACVFGRQCPAPLTESVDSHE